MNKISLFLLSSFLFISCSSSQKNDLDLCENELLLLGSFEDLPFINANISELRDSLSSPLKSLFQSEGYFIRYKVNHSIDNQDISMKMASSDLTKYPGIPPPFNPYVYWIHIYPQKSDSVLFRRKITSIDSIHIKIKEWYESVDFEYYDKVNIAFYWDSESEPKKLDQIINESIKGYLSFANDFSLKKFIQPLCSLSKRNLDSVSKSVPFQLRTDFFGSEKLNRWDFTPATIPQ